jgi:transcriptional regulator of acetoin/glycerol metabolism
MERLALVRRSTQGDADWLELLRQVMPVKPGEQTLTIQISTQSGYKSAIEAAETAILRQMAAACGNNYSQLAQQLGIGRTTLWRKLRQLNVSKRE